MPFGYSYWLKGFSQADQALVHQIIADYRGWSGLGYTFWPVGSQGQANIRIRLTSRAQIHHLFGSYFDGLSVAHHVADGTDIYIDSHNWHRVPTNFVGSRALYRAYVIQHELGHAIGYNHRRARAGLACPVMYQQTKGTRGICRSNPWITQESR
jgi:hypothetical protein